jgi:hypothetical protein
MNVVVHAHIKMALWPPAPPPRQTLERHLQRLGATHVEGCGSYEDHHMFALEELTDAIR